MPEGFLLNGLPITQEIYTELCNRFPDTYGDDAERIQREKRELQEKALRELTQEASLRQSPSQVSITPLSTPFTPSSKPPSSNLPTQNLTVLLEDEERVPSPEASLVPRTSRKSALTKTPPIEVLVEAKEPESVAESL